MRRLLILALGASALLATTSAEAHSHPRLPKGPAHSVAHTLHVAPDSLVAPASLTTGPTFHASYSAPHVSSGGFHSMPTYRSFSATPSRTYNFSRASSPSISTRPATTLTPRTYTYNISGVPRPKTYTPAPSSQPAEVHHYHNSGGGGPSVTDMILLNAALNSNRQNQGTSTPDTGTGRFVSDNENYSPAQADKPDDGLSGWQIFGTVLVVGGIIYGGYRYVTQTKTGT
ncbi:MAG: hypothetical protein ACRYF0_07870 [Janthinobacterium lividum]